MEKVSGFSRVDEEIELPPGFRFHPTDEELITHYLSPKVINSSFSARAIGEVDLNKVEPWDLPRRATTGEKEWYFFCTRNRKYPTGLKTNRATEAGYWKATGKDREIFSLKILVGMKKTLVFHRGRAPKGEKTGWVMHEFRLEGKYSTHNLPKNAKNEWVISRIFKKRNHDANPQPSDLPPLMDLSSSKKTEIPLATLNFPKVSTPNSVPFIQNIQDHSNYEVGLGSYEDQEFPIISAENMDFECLWNC
ncbi:unnamed protein product [Fraxinus pennsylvanica]|uniref:NAC domain-containing protein n=1 Tax=Fraxinus pennsylvanica TaxID=56036 RepID=A0AAD1ZCS4_9LAMI|nr:unnamed protein product [Fraxinus pennsylvanica]